MLDGFKSIPRGDTRVWWCRYCGRCNKFRKRAKKCFNCHRVVAKNMRNYAGLLILSEGLVGHGKIYHRETTRCGVCNAE